MKEEENRIEGQRIASVLGNCTTTVLTMSMTGLYYWKDQVLIILG